MPDRKISQLPASLGFAADDLVPFVDTSSSTTRRATLPEFGRAVGAANVFFPRNFGAVGDGTTDDVDAINDCVIAASATGNGIVDGEGLIYAIAASTGSVGVAVLSNVWMRNFTIVLLAGADAHVLSLTDVTNVKVSDFAIDGNAADQTANVHGIRVNGATRLLVCDGYITDTPGYGIGLQAGSMVDVTLRDLRIHSTGRDGIDFKNNDSGNVRITLDRVHVTRHGQDNTADQTGIDLRGRDIIVSNCSVSDFGDLAGGTSITGIRCRQGETVSAAGTGAHESVIENCVVRASHVLGAHDFSVFGFNIVARNVQVTNCKAVGCLRSFIVGQRGCTLTNCTSVDATEDGFFLDDQNIDADITSESDFCVMTACRVIVDEVVDGTAQVGDGSLNKIRLAAGASALDDFYMGRKVWITSGLRSPAIRQIIAYDGTTRDATVDSNYSTAQPDATSVYKIFAMDDGVEVRTDQSDIEVFGLGILDGPTAVPGTQFVNLLADSSGNRVSPVQTGWLNTVSDAGTDNRLMTSPAGTTITTPAGNTTTGEDDLMTWTLPASMLSAARMAVEFLAAGTLANTIGQKRLRVKLGSTTLLDTGATGLSISAAVDWVIRGEIIRTGAATQKCAVTIITNDAVFRTSADYVAATEDLTTALVLKVTGEGVATNDIVQELLTVEVTG